MPDIVSVKLEGSAALLRALRATGGNARKAIRAASKAGGDVIKDDAELRAPPTRHKKKLISKASFPRKDLCEVTIKLAKKSWYLKYFETGATAHEISGAGGALAFEGDAGPVVTRSVRHPGMPARPFLRPAFDGKQRQATDRVGEVLRQAVVEARVAQAAAEESED